jgi:anaphase-promoting complex subunit 10
MALANPSGWQDVPLVGCGGGADGNALCCWVVQMVVKENAQNGKDTHIRGLRVFALDEGSDGRAMGAVEEMVGNMDEAVAAGRREGAAGDAKAAKGGAEMADGDALFARTLDALVGGVGRLGGAGWMGEGGFSTVPDFMRDPEIR